MHRKGNPLGVRIELGSSQGEERDKTKGSVAPKGVAWERVLSVLTSFYSALSSFSYFLLYVVFFVTDDTRSV